MGGCELQLLNLCRALQKKGIDLIILYGGKLNGFNEELVEGIPAFKIPAVFFSLRIIPLYLVYFFKFKLKRTPSLFHCHALTHFNEQIGWFSKMSQVPALIKIATDGDMTALNRRLSCQSFTKVKTFIINGLFGRVRMKSYLSFSGYICLNSSIKEELKSFSIQEEKIHSIPNGVDCDRFSPVSLEEKRKIRAEFGFPLEGQLILMAARFIEEKRFSDLILAYFKIRERFPKAILVLVGDGPDRKRCEELGKGVVFRGVQREIEKYYKAADLFAFTSSHEGLPNVILEAMASALPIVATHLSGIEELIHPFEEGLLVPPKDVDAIAEALSYLLEHPEEGQKMALRAREKVVMRYSIEKIAEAFISCYQGLST
jgi:glycosyltransferase involved in cell wall biosynthesis